MSISSEITRINGNIASAYTAVSGKGGHSLPLATAQTYPQRLRAFQAAAA